MAMVCLRRRISDPRSLRLDSDRRRSDAHSRSRRRTGLIALFALTASAPYGNSPAEDEYTLPKSKIHLRDCYKAVDDMNAGKVQQIAGYHMDEGYYVRLTVKGEHGSLVIATCDIRTGKIVRVREERVPR